VEPAARRFAPTSATTVAGVRHNRPMEPKVDPLRRDMHVERLSRDDGRKLLLYSWPERTDASPPTAAGEPRLEPWSPDSGPADV
jgi:hypothetical protein